MSALGPLVGLSTLALLVIYALVYSLCVTAKQADQQIERMENDRATSSPDSQ